MYIIIGVMTTVINWGIYICCMEIIRISMTASNAVAWVGAVIFAFVTNKLVVFNSKNPDIKTIMYEVFSFVTTRILSGIIEVFLPELLFIIGLNFSIFGIKGFVAKGIVSIFVIIFNYITSKMVVFRKKN